MNQFQRCLTHYFNISLDEAELLHLASKYGDTNNIDYQLFSESIDKCEYSYCGCYHSDYVSLAFDPDQLDGRPEDQVIRGEDKGTSVILTDDELLVTQQLISKCYSYCRVSVTGA